MLKPDAKLRKHLFAAFLLLVFGAALRFPRPVAAQPQGGDEDETAFLRMYFPKEAVAEGPTRHPKPLSQVAENVTIVTADEIRDMNAHTVAEVLNRVNGVFVDTFGGNFGSLSLTQIQGSREEHVLFLVDGVPWNYLGGGNAETVTIPVGAIDRIEVIKGPASSAWGSSLGGVVNVITKAIGKASTPGGKLSASYGERNALDGRAEVAGAAGRLGYYLHGGLQNADWQRHGGEFWKGDAYAKLSLPLGSGVRVGLTAGYSRPVAETGRLPSQGATVKDELESLFGTATLVADLTRQAGFYVSAYGYNQTLEGRGVEDGTFGPAGDLVRETVFDEKTYGARSRLVWHPEDHTLVLGFDYDHGALDQTVRSGPYFQSLGFPERLTTHPNLTRWGVYLNDTYAPGAWTFTPGLRYDGNSETSSFLSPSLGVTRALGANTVLRALAARGFSLPPLAQVSGGGFGMDPNPDLEPEKVWSFQGGIETKAIPYLWGKLTAFRHEVEDARVQVASDRTPGNTMHVNRGRSPRTGLEAELESAPVLRTSLRAAFAYVKIDQPGDLRDLDRYTADLGVLHRWEESLHAELLGHFVWWDQGAGAREGDHNDVLWDLNVRKRFPTDGGTATEVFFTAHNLFNGRQYTDEDRKNPNRWVEGGVRFRF